VFRNYYVPILHRFCDIPRYWSKIDLLDDPLGMTHLECRRDFWR